MLAEWDKSIKEPQKRLERFVRIMYDSTPPCCVPAAPIRDTCNGVCQRRAGTQGAVENVVRYLSALAGQSVQRHGYTEEAHDLSLQLLARGQGLIVVSQVYPGSWLPLNAAPGAGPLDR